MLASLTECVSFCRRFVVVSSVNRSFVRSLDFFFVERMNDKFKSATGVSALMGRARQREGGGYPKVV